MKWRAYHLIVFVFNLLREVILNEKWHGEFCVKFWCHHWIIARSKLYWPYFRFDILSFCISQRNCPWAWIPTMSKFYHYPPETLLVLTFISWHNLFLDKYLLRMWMSRLIAEGICFKPQEKTQTLLKAQFHLMVLSSIPTAHDLQ